MNTTQIKVVGYVSKAGKLGTYKQVARAADKYNPGEYRVCLESFGDKPIKFWVAESKIVASTPKSESSRRSSRDWPGKECPACGSEPLNSELYCWECGYQGKVN